MTDFQSQVISNAQDFQSHFKIHFSNQNLIIQALKHRSFLVVSNENHNESNERLEFLGDSILNFILTDFLFNRYISLSEGQLSKMKAILVSKRVLAKVAQDKNYGDFILMNFGEEKSGGRERLSVLSDAYEAIIGAIYLDKGLSDVKEMVNTDIISRHVEFLNNRDFKNYKSHLLEYFQSEGITLPIYSVIEESGPEHQKLFTIHVFSNTTFLGEGKGSSKKDAEQRASKNAIENINKGKVIVNAK